MRYLSYLCVFVFVCLAYWGWHRLTAPGAFPIRQVQVVVQADSVFKASVIEQQAKQHIVGGFFSVNVDALKQNLLALPWVADVSIQRRWPDSLLIRVTEQQAVARWGEKGIFNTAGHVFYPALATIPKTLARIEGPEAESKEIFDHYQKLKKDAESQHLTILRLTVSPRLSYRVLLSSGLWVIIGREQVSSRFQRFMRVYSKVTKHKHRRIQSVDLRYPNGVSVSWKK